MTGVRPRAPGGLKGEETGRSLLSENQSGSECKTCWETDERKPCVCVSPCLAHSLTLAHCRRGGCRVRLPHLCPFHSGSPSPNTVTCLIHILSTRIPHWHPTEEKQTHSWCCIDESVAMWPRLRVGYAALKHVATVRISRNPGPSPCFTFFSAEHAQASQSQRDPS